MKHIVEIALLLACCVIISSCSAKEKVIGLRQNIHHDDFEYSVQSVDKADHIGGLQPRGVFYIVVFQVENRARRVDHRWSNDIAYVLDETGTRRDNDAPAQQELNRMNPFGLKNDYVTPAGVTETTTLVFDLPKDAKEPYLRVRGDVLMGDVFDGNQYRKTKVRLF
jgi:hypothetical protein